MNKYVLWKQPTSEQNTEAEKYLTNMHQRGYRIKNVGWLLMTFERVEPSENKIAIRKYTENDRKLIQEFILKYEKEGYKLIDTIGDYYYFENISNVEVFLDDEEEKSESKFKTYFYSLVCIFTFILIPLYYIFQNGFEIVTQTLRSRGTFIILVLIIVSAILYRINRSKEKKDIEVNYQQRVYYYKLINLSIFLLFFMLYQVGVGNLISDLF